MSDDMKRCNYLPPQPQGGGYSQQKQDQYNQYLRKLQQDFKQIWGEKTEESVAKLTDFEKQKVLGTGAFGIVYLAKHIASGKYYAMKMLEKEKIVKLKQIEHSFYEKKILIGLNFPFVVYMKYFFKDNVYLYYILPFIPGGEMFSHLRKMGKFEESAAKFYGAQVVLALEYLHACELVYRDLKPENILIDRTGYIKITDFGFCKLIHGRTWTLCGTPEYLAPEIILSKGYGMSVDWWSLGILLFEMSAGHPPFYASDPMRIYEKIVSGKYRCPAHFTAELKDLIGHVLQVDTTRRYGNLKDGILDFKNHKWFREIDWDNLLNGRVQPPFLPKVRSPGDTTNFDVFDEEKIKDSPLCLFEDEFADF
ncbi:cAMP-dependent protein kinase catalytic subunit alpha-like [Amyelois transitella]|uniref:cAMP-dependent protein kinase catalytic subunit alpha-like n=1 Tax=Amyelois transitella TaxID=680683 RepID=UPI0029906522|nr:cAMP-dependent protein kinase catalytic subunit alpha-like [Amyelois transitella]